MQVQEKFNSHHWRHVPMKENPADIGSRGMVASELKDNYLWFHGPPFLLEPCKFWPLNIVEKQLTLDAQAEEKAIPVMSLILSRDQVGLIEQIFDND